LGNENEAATRDSRAPNETQLLQTRTTFGEELKPRVGEITQTNIVIVIVTGLHHGRPPPFSRQCHAHILAEEVAHVARANGVAMGDAVAVDGQGHGQALVDTDMAEVGESLHHFGQAGVGLTGGAQRERVATGAFQVAPALAHERARIAIAVAPVHVLHYLHQCLVRQHGVN
jgi:hypothetical protein